MVLVVVFLVVGIWTRRLVLMVGLAIAVSLRRDLRRTAATCAIVAVVGCALGLRSWAQAVPRELGPFRGVARLMTDPTPRNGVVQAVLEIDGQRFELWARGSPRRRLATRSAGEHLWVDGTRRALSGSAAHRAAIRHVVGGFDATAVGDAFPGSRFDQASNRVRGLLAKGADVLAFPDSALFGGLVIGDDRFEPPEMIAQFRVAGMSHLTAVSGQNVAFVLAAAAPLLHRLRPWWRWAGTLALICWFVALTRFEPSVLRAGCMAAISATAFVLGRDKPASRVVPLAVALLVMIDPMLVWSVGFWLSVGATTGVAVIAPRVLTLLRGPAWLCEPLAITIGAQIGVAPVALMVFNSLPIVSLPANLLAVPVAGFVMLYGLPAGIVAGAVPHWLATLVQLPSAFGTRWVATVAALASRIEPPMPWPLVLWAAVVAGLGVLWLHRRRR